jgi:arylsulfatase A-like enzyme
VRPTGLSSEAASGLPSAALRTEREQPESVRPVPLRGGERRTPPRAASLALALAALACTDPTPPNVVLVSIDTLRADSIGAYGGPVPTPGLDRLAAEGVLLEQAFAPTPTTAPSHVTLLSGLHVQNHGTLGNGPITLRELPLEAAFRRAGHHTAGFVSSYVLSDKLGWAAGFAHYDADFSRSRSELRSIEVDLEEMTEIFEGEELDRNGIHTTEAARAWLASAPEPFFLFVHYFDPHTPYAQRKHYLARLRAAAIDLAGRGTPEYTGEKLRRAVFGYHAEVLFVDDALQGLLAALDDRRLRDRTLVVVTADHGEGLGQHGWMGHTVHLYDEQIHVPLLLRWPGRLPAGARLAEPVGLVDVAPTIAELAGVALPGTVDGRSLAAALQRGVEPEPAPVFGIRPRFKKPFGAHFGEKRSVRSGRWKLIRAEDGPEELYDLQSDPGETRNLRGDRPEIAAELAALLERHAATRSGVAAQPELTEEQRRALEALGYVEAPAQPGEPP